MVPSVLALSSIDKCTARASSAAYIEALLVDEELAGQVWEAWVTGEIDDRTAWLAWQHIAGEAKRHNTAITLKSTMALKDVQNTYGDYGKEDPPSNSLRLAE